MRLGGGPLSLRKATLGAGVEAPTLPQHAGVLRVLGCKPARRQSPGALVTSSSHGGVRTEKSQLVLDEPHRAETWRPIYFSMCTAKLRFCLQPALLPSVPCFRQTTGRRPESQGHGEICASGMGVVSRSLQQGTSWPYASWAPKAKRIDKSRVSSLMCL